MQELYHRTDVDRNGVPPRPFSVDVRPDRRRVILAPQGELDIATVDALGAEIDGLVQRGFDAIVVDLRGLSFIDSTGLHLLVRATAREDARIAVIDGERLVRRVIDLAGVRHLLRFEPAGGAIGVQRQ